MNSNKVNKLRVITYKINVMYFDSYLYVRECVSLSNCLKSPLASASLSRRY